MHRKAAVMTAGAVKDHYSDLKRLWSGMEALCDLFFETVPFSSVTLGLPSDEPCRP